MYGPNIRRDVITIGEVVDVSNDEVRIAIKPELLRGSVAAWSRGPIDIVRGDVYVAGLECGADLTDGIVKCRVRRRGFSDIRRGDRVISGL
jgi:hypothetical protein